VLPPSILHCATPSIILIERRIVANHGESPSSPI
jgi:hypothetical protein